MIYGLLFWEFFKVGIFCVGGGYASMPLIQASVVDTFHWLTMSEFVDIFTISQMTPGPIGINAATFVGTRIAGLPGAIVATMGFVTPSFFLGIILARIFLKYGDIGPIRGILNGLRPAVVALICVASLSFILLALWNTEALPSDWLGFSRGGLLILIGAIAAALLAVVVSGIIKFLEKRSLKVIGLSFIVALGVLILSTMNLGGLSGNTLIAAGKLGSEPEILINMYKDLIEDETDIKVTVKPSFGKTSFLYEALKNGSIDMYPEFTGTVTSSLIKPPMTGLSNDPAAVYEAAKAAILKQDDLVLLEPMEYQNTYAVAVKRSYAEQYGLKTISDLRKVENTARAGFSLEFNDREDGNKGLKSLYGLTLSVVTMEPSLRYEAIDKGNVDVIDVFSTDPEIITHDLVMLQDDKGLFPPYQGAPLLRADTIKKYPQLVPVLNKLANMITTDEMLKMNYEVDVEGKPAADVARAYLVSKGLLKQ
ncbi:MAG: glycine betaine ABC transporter substrate-binding protein [Megasphaera sp.]|nr:glycine betaine ABC transporter substrate-binding protein [Megasphaera sp.]